MSLVPFSPPPGLNSDDTTFKAEGRWADGSNVRFRDGSPQVIGGEGGLLTELGTTTLDLFAFTRDDVTYLAYGGEGTLYVGEGVAVPTDRSPVGISATFDGWAMAAWGSTLLAAVRGGKLYAQSGTSAASEVTQAPDQITDMVVTRRQVIAAGTNEELSGDFNGMCIRWSDFEDYTAWTSSSINNAGEYVIDGAGAIVAIREIGQYLGVWTSSSLYIGQFVGDPSQTWRFDKVDDGCGLTASRAVCVSGGVAYWLSHDNRLRRWSPGSPPDVLPCPVLRDFASHLTSDPVTRSMTFVASIEKFQEIWCFYADDRENKGFPTRYVAVSLADGSWFRGIMPRTAMLDSGLLRTALEAAGCDSNIVAFSPPDGEDDQGTLWVQEAGLNPSPPDWFIQSGDQYMDEGGRRVMVRSFRPDFARQGADINMTLYVRDRPQSAPVTKGPYNIPDAATKKDFRASGMIMAVRISQGNHGQNNDMRIGKLVFDMVPMGER